MRANHDQRSNSKGASLKVTANVICIHEIVGEYGSASTAVEIISQGLHKIQGIMIITPVHK